MSTNSEIIAAKKLTREVAQKLHSAPSFQQLPKASQQNLLHNLETITSALTTENCKTQNPQSDPYAFALDTPDDFYRRMHGQQEPQVSGEQPGAQFQEQSESAGPKNLPMHATSQLAQNAGALMDEIDFPAFIGGLISGTWDAMVDSSIRQMEAYADLVSAVARNAGDFIRDNITVNQAKDWLAERYPQDLDMSNPPNLVPRQSSSDWDSSDNSPAWLGDFGLDGETLTQELIDEQLIPAARQRVGDNRLKNLATMVLLGMNRIRIRDGSITARVLFRAAAKDRTKLDYAVSNDPRGTGWGSRGSGVYETHSTKISTVGINAQSTATLRAELFGEVKINFESETLPLERLVDQARINLLQQNSRNPELPPPTASVTPPGNSGPAPDETAES